MRHPIQTPVLLLLWRRSDYLTKLFEVLREVRPSQIFISCDGPNSNIPDQINQVNNVRFLLLI